MSKKIIRMYLHSNKETNWFIGEKIGLKEDALRMFRYALCEVEAKVEVDMKTGKVKLLSVK